MRPSRSILIPFAVAVVATPRPAAASSGFEAAMETELSLEYTPPCEVCHQGSATTGTAKTAFAKAMKLYGLQGADVKSVAVALDELAAAKIDSDGDCVPDVAQLVQGRDPSTGAYIDGSGKPKPPKDPACASSNDGGAGGDPVYEASYGCGAQVAGGPSAKWPGLAAVLTMLGLVLSRRRRAAR